MMIVSFAFSVNFVQSLAFRFMSLRLFFVSTHYLFATIFGDMRMGYLRY